MTRVNGGEDAMKATMSLSDKVPRAPTYVCITHESTKGRRQLAAGAMSHSTEGQGHSDRHGNVMSRGPKANRLELNFS